MREVPNKFLIKSWDKFILEGDTEALSQVYFHYYDLLFTYGLKHTSKVHFVEDTIQDVFLNLIRQRKNIGPVKNIAGYLVSSFRHQLFLSLNAQKKAVLFDQLSDEQFSFYKGPEASAADMENLEQVYSTVKKCMGMLTPKQQEIIYLRFESGISYEEISKMLDISVDSCYKSVYRSIRIIRSKAEKILQSKGNLFLWYWFGPLVRRFFNEAKRFENL